MIENTLNKIPSSLPLKEYYLSSSYGIRTHPILRKRLKHDGIDIAGRHKTPIYSTADGIVVFTGNKGSYGKLVKIKHPLGFQTYYGHLSKISVKSGDIIKRGDIIGLQGNTGRSTGSHLHYEVRYKGQTYNPAQFLKVGQENY